VAKVHVFIEIIVREHIDRAVIIVLLPFPILPKKIIRRKNVVVIWFVIANLPGISRHFEVVVYT
jgi:hypothetical protein